jgi:uncharacterized protein HemX
MFHFTPLFAIVDEGDRSMSSTPESPQPQATHSITQTTTEQVANGPLQDGGVHIDLRWSHKAVAAAVLIASLAASFFTFTATQWGGITRDTQAVHDRLDALENWQRQMTAIAQQNTEARIRTEENMKQLHEGQAEIKTLIQEHMGIVKRSKRSEP